MEVNWNFVFALLVILAIVAMLRDDLPNLTRFVREIFRGISRFGRNDDD